MINRHQQHIIIDNLKRLHPVKIGVFGSFARGENNQASDLDILIFLNYDRKTSLLDLIEAEQSLSQLLGVKVDLVTERSLNPYIRPYVEKDLTIIYE